MRKSKISSEKKIEIVMEYLSGKVGYKKESVRLAGNSKFAMRRWVFQYKTGGEQFFCRKRRTTAIVQKQSLQRCGRICQEKGARKRLAKNMDCVQVHNSDSG